MAKKFTGLNGQHFISTAKNGLVKKVRKQNDCKNGGKSVIKTKGKLQAKKNGRMMPNFACKDKAAAASWPPTYAQIERTRLRPTVQDVLDRLERTPARVGVSSVSGVGLIAVRPIKKGEKLYTGMEKPCFDEFGDAVVAVKKSRITELMRKPGLEGIGHMVHAYIESYPDDNDGEETYGMVWTALDRMHPIWFMNDGGANHNVCYLDGDETDGLVAVRDIAEGEELLVKFDALGDGNDHEVSEYPKDAAWVEAKANSDKLRQAANDARKAAAEAQKRLAESETALVTVAREAARRVTSD